METGTVTTAASSSWVWIGAVIFIFLVLIGVILLFVYATRTTATNASNNNNNRPVVATNGVMVGGSASPVGTSPGDFRPGVLNLDDVRKICDSRCRNGFTGATGPTGVFNHNILPRVAGQAYNPPAINIPVNDRNCCEEDRCDNFCGKPDIPSYVEQYIEEDSSSYDCSDAPTYDSKDCQNACDLAQYAANEHDYFSALDNKVVDFGRFQPQDIKDITDNGRYVFAVLKSSPTTIVMQEADYNSCSKDKCHINNKQCTVTSKIALDRLLVFRDDFYALSGGLLYKRDPASQGKTTWYWYQVEGSPTNITWIAKTYDEQYLWLQTSTMGFLYNKKRHLLETMDIPSNIQRFFGSNIEIVGDLNMSTFELTTTLCDKRFVNIGTSIFNAKDSIVFVRPNQLSTVRAIRLVLCKPYYLLA